MISVIVPVYNTEKYLDKCLESIVTQSYSDLEIILVDDGSDDGSLEKCEYWRKRDQRIILVKQTNKGAGAARNKGFLSAKGEYLSFIDSDDWIDQDFYKKMYDAIITTKSDLVCCDFYLAEGNKTTYADTTNGFYSEKISIDNYLIYGSTSICNTLSEKKFWIKNNIKFPEMRFEDAVVKPLLLVYAKKIYFVHEGLYYYRRCREGSASNRVKDTYTEFTDAFDYLIAELVKRSLYDSFKKILYLRIKNTLSLPKSGSPYDRNVIQREHKFFSQYLKSRFPINCKEDCNLYVSFGSFFIGRVRDEVTIFRDVYYKNQFMSIIGVMSKKEATIEFAHPNPFRNLMLEREISHAFWDTLEEEKSDYFILDLLEERYDLIALDGNIYTNSEAFSELGLFAKNEEYRIILRESEECQKIWQQACLEFIKRLRRIYSAQQVILVKNYLLNRYGNIQESCLYEMQREIKVKNEILKKYYDFFEANFKGIIVIDGCEKCYRFTDESHKYGVQPWNYNSYAIRDVKEKIKQAIKISKATK